MILFIVSILLLLLFIILFFNLIKGFQITEKLLAVFILGCAFLVLALELAGIINKLNEPYSILLLQALLVIAASFLNYKYKLGFPPILLSNIKRNILTVLGSVKKNYGTFVFFCLILSTYIFLAYLQVRFPQNTTDSLVNHLSRIGHWLQQGTLKPYIGFNNVGSSFPFVNSLLMLWSVVFLRSDLMVGYVQFVATFMLSISIYSMGKEFGYSRKANFLASLFFLTFPIIVFESISAQNDILVACYLMISFYFLIRYTHTFLMMYLVVSILSIALALGTKQYAFFALPGYLILFVFMLLKSRSSVRTILLKSTIYALSFIIVFSSYSYLQNWKYYGNPMGDNNSIVLNIKRSKNENFLKKMIVNSLRLSYQFLSCEGIPPSLNSACIEVKTNLLKPVLSNSLIDLEKDSYLLDKNEIFTYNKKYSLNEESSWYGMIGSMLIILAIPYGFYISIKNKRFERIILIFTAIIFFLITSSVKTGWDPYVGRYLIFSIAVIFPFFAGMLNDKKLINNIFLGIISTISIFIMFYSLMNNDSRPLISQNQLLKLQRWGNRNSLYIQKIAYKLTPFVRNDLPGLDFWNASDTYIETFGKKYYRTPLYMIDIYVPENTILGILNPPGYNFPDYLFFGESFNRRLVIFTQPELFLGQHPKIDFLLISPDFHDSTYSEFQLVVERDGWRVLWNMKEE